jgi:hypothetical protein
MATSKVPITPEMKLTIEEGLIDRKPTPIIFQEVLKVSPKETRQRIIELSKKHNINDILDVIRELPMHTESAIDWIAYRGRRTIQIAKERGKTFVESLEEARHKPMIQALKTAGLGVLEATEIPFAPVAAFVREPIKEEAIKRGASSTVAEVLSWVPELAVAGYGLVKGGISGARLARQMLKKEPATRAEEMALAYARHEELTFKPVPKDVWDSIYKKFRVAERIEKRAKEKLEAPRKAKIARYYGEELPKAYEEGTLEAIQRARGTLKEELTLEEKFQKELQRRPKLAKVWETLRLTPEEEEALIASIRHSALNIKDANEALETFIRIKEGKLPQRHHLEWLAKLLGVKPLQVTRVIQAGELSATARAIMASSDLSALFRQGIMALRRKEFWKNIPLYIRTTFSEKTFREEMMNIYKHPYYRLAQKSGVPITDTLTVSEEMFTSRAVRKIPYLRKVVEMSERGYTAFLNKLRFDTFVHMADKLHKTGHNISEHPELFKKLGEYIGAMTGRGPLYVQLTPSKQINLSGLAKLDLFFAPRLITSRLYYLNPMTYVSLPKEIRLEVIKDVLAFLSFGLSTVSLAWLAGAKVVTEPTSADFMKIKVGDTRIDPWGGFHPWVVLMARLAEGEFVSTTTGKTFTLGNRIAQIKPRDLLYWFFEAKTAPMITFALNWIEGSTIEGTKYDVVKELINRFTPMVAQDLYDIITLEPVNLWAFPFSIAGFGVQTYSANPYYNGTVDDEVFKRVNDGLTDVGINIPIVQQINLIKLNEKEEELFRKAFGKAVYERLHALFNSEAYQNAPPGLKEKAVNKVITKTKMEVEAKLFPYLIQLKTLRDYYKIMYGTKEGEKMFTKAAEKWARTLGRKIEK